MNARRLAFVLLFLGTTLPASVHGQAGKAKSKDAFEELTPYVHPDFCAAVVIHPARMASSPFGKSVDLTQLVAAGVQESELDANQVMRFADPAKVRRLTVLVDPFPGGNVAFFPALIIEYQQDIPGAEMFRKIWPGSQPSRSDKRLFVGLDSMAGAPINGYVAGPRTILIAPEPTLEKMRSKRRPAINPLRSQLAKDSGESEIVVQYVSDPVVDKALDASGMTKAQLRADPNTDEVVKTLVLDVKSASLHLQLTKRQMIQVEIECAGRNDAVQLNDALDVGMGMLNTVFNDEAGRKELKKQLEGELPKAAVDLVDSKATRDFINAIGYERQGDTIEVKVYLPQTVMDVAKKSTVKLIAGLKPIEDKGQWIRIFRSDDPKIWNTDVSDGPDRFAVPLVRVPAGIKYLKLQIDDKRFAIVEITRDKLDKRGDNGKIGWEGTNHFQWAGRHLGIYDKRKMGQDRGTIHILTMPNRGALGWGFGNRVRIDDHQGYSWARKEIPKTVFEISVKSGNLTAAERKALLK